MATVNLPHNLKTLHWASGPLSFAGVYPLASPAGRGDNVAFRAVETEVAKLPVDRTSSIEYRLGTSEGKGTPAESPPRPW